MDLLPSFRPFACNAAPNRLLFSLTIDDDTKPIKERQPIRKFDTGNGDTIVYRLNDGGYQFIIRDIHNRDCCLLITNNTFSECRCALNGDWVMRSFGLNDAIMLVYAFAGAFHHTMLIHASTIMQGDYGYPFIAQSGTGKSTHSALWMTHIENCQLMNDDNPVVRIMEDGQPYIFGSPWSGKTPCYRNVKYPLGGVVQLSQAPYNKIQRLKPLAAYAALVPSISGKRWDKQVAEGLHETEDMMAGEVAVWHLECLPDEAAARLCSETINKA